MYMYVMMPLFIIVATAVLLGKRQYMDYVIASINDTNVMPCLMFISDIFLNFSWPPSLRAPSSRRVRRAVATPLQVMNYIKFFVLSMVDKIRDSASNASSTSCFLI